MRGLLVIICAATTAVLAAPKMRATGPIVTLDQGTFIGTTGNGTNRFYGIPFARPPVGDLRFRLPQEPDPYAGTYNATAFGLSCPQQATTLPVQSGFPQQTVDYLELLDGPAPTPDGEDCLTLNVVAPADVNPGSKLPVVAWIFGGGFENGSPASYDGSVIVNRSMEIQQPIIYVSINYRVSGFGFLASQEVKDAGVGNLGLWDQRQGLRWIQKYISAFGGDPSKVTIWGQSAGAMSASLQMVANGGNPEGLFHAAFLQSGSLTPTADITHGQQYYDFLVENTNCSGSSDTLECLRAAPYDQLKAAVDRTPSFFSYQSLALAWNPLVDGVFLADDPQTLVRQGIVARIPLVSGACDDEGTTFSLSQLNVTTDAELRTYFSTYFYTNATDAQMDELLQLYPQDPTQGSPYDTGTQNELTPEYKRVAALMGDIVFHSPQRLFLKNVSDKQKTWSYLSKRMKSLPIIGAGHGSDLLNVYGDGDLTDFLIHFVTNLDPNGGGLSPEWPLYTTSSPQLMTFLDGQTSNRTITLDTYRAEAIEFVTSLSFASPL